MSGLLSTFTAMLKDENGATAIEYAMIAGGIAIAVVSGVAIIGGKVSGTFTSAANGF